MKENINPRWIAQKLTEEDADVYGILKTQGLMSVSEDILLALQEENAFEEIVKILVKAN